MNKKIVEISPFLKMKADQLNWTGYNAALIDEATDLGLQLEEENKELQDKLKLYNSDRTDFFTGMGKMVGGGIAIIVCVFLIGLAIKGIGKDEIRGQAYKDAYKDAVTNTITYVEGKYRGVSTDRIKIELLQDAYIFDKDMWIKSNSVRYASMTETESNYNEIMKSPVYNVFVNSK